MSYKNELKKAYDLYASQHDSDSKMFKQEQVHREIDEKYRKSEAFDKLMMYFEKSSMRSTPELYFYNSADPVFDEYYESEESE